MSHKLDVSTRCVGRVLKKYSIEFWREEKVPQSTPEQVKNQKRCLSKFCGWRPGSGYGRRAFFAFNILAFSGNRLFYSSNKRNYATSRQLRCNNNIPRTWRSSGKKIRRNLLNKIINQLIRFCFGLIMLAPIMRVPPQLGYEVKE